MGALLGASNKQVGGTGVPITAARPSSAINSEITLEIIIWPQLISRRCNYIGCYR